MNNYHVVVFHKCASNWTRRLFLHVAELRGLNVYSTLKNKISLNRDIDRNSAETLRIYARGEVDYKEFRSHWSPGEKVVLCIRDPKDALVSQFWSWRNTHSINGKQIVALRPILQSLGVEGGLEKLIQEEAFPYAKGVRAWYGSLTDPAIHLLRYEDLLGDFRLAMRKALDHLDLDVTDAELDAMHEMYSFKATTGREPGNESRSSHYRKGIAGDWRASFSPQTVSLFNERYGDVCERLGYPLADDAATAP